jgi:VIT1/CCC1 family predicted Fe2+/Mn2+ transporter
MSLEIFLLGLLIVSTLTGLVTEAIKNLLDEHKKNYYANTLAGFVAVVLSVMIGAAYVILAGAALNAQMAVYLIALIFLSWLSAMVGYDKVMQAIAQFKTYSKED